MHACMPTNELDTSARLKSLRQHGSQKPGRTKDSRATPVSTIQLATGISSYVNASKLALEKYTEHRIRTEISGVSRSLRAVRREHNGLQHRLSIASFIELGNCAPTAQADHAWKSLEISSWSTSALLQIEYYGITCQIVRSSAQTSHHPLNG